MIFAAIIITFIVFVASVALLCILDNLYLNGVIAKRIQRHINSDCNQDCNQGRNCNCGR